VPSALTSQMSKLVFHGSSRLAWRTLIATCLPSADQAKSDRSPNGLDGMSPAMPPLSNVAALSMPSPPSFAANTRFRRPSFQASQWRMNMRSKTVPVALAASAASSFFFVQSRSALHSGNTANASATWVPSGESL